MKKELFRDIKIEQNKHNKKQFKPEGYWNFGWSFKYKSYNCGNTVDNVKRDNNIFATSFLGIFSADPKKKLTCEIQILMVEDMLKAMKRLRKEKKGE